MKCDYCDNVVSNDLLVCPHCGAPLKKVIRVSTRNTVNVNSKIKKESEDNKFINVFLYGTIVIGIILIIVIILLRFK